MATTKDTNTTVRHLAVPWLSPSTSLLPPTDPLYVKFWFLSSSSSTCYINFWSFSLDSFALCCFLHVSKLKEFTFACFVLIGRCFTGFLGSPVQTRTSSSSPELNVLLLLTALLSLFQILLQVSYTLFTFVCKQSLYLFNILWRFLIL